MRKWTFELKPELAAVRAAALDFRAWASNHASPSVVSNCELALVEACNNLVQHAPTKHSIHLAAETNLAELRILVRDRTTGFDWPANPQLSEPDSEHGRGLYLIHALMTEVRYVRNPNGNELHLRRRF